MYPVTIGDRIEGEHKIILYQVFSFYCELYYHIEGGFLAKLRSFSSVEYLDKYIQQFDLTNIVKNCGPGI